MIIERGVCIIPLCFATEDIKADVVFPAMDEFDIVDCVWSMSGSKAPKTELKKMAAAAAGLGDIQKIVISPARTPAVKCVFPVNSARPPNIFCAYIIPLFVMFVKLLKITCDSAALRR